MGSDQFVDSVDSIVANIAEGFGRFHYRDNMRFYYYSRGSLLEAKHWIKLLYQRGLITKETADIPTTSQISTTFPYFSPLSLANYKPIAYFCTPIWRGSSDG
jgi:hypothetical protein